jgi:hypothetical protein
VVAVEATDRQILKKEGEEMEHPVISRINLTGYATREPKYYGNDFFGNEVHEGDVIYLLEDEFFLKETLFEDSIKILEAFGAYEVNAGEE